MCRIPAFVLYVHQAVFSHRRNKGTAVKRFLHCRWLTGSQREQWKNKSELHKHRSRKAPCLCVREKQGQMWPPVFCTHLLKEKRGVFVSAGRSYLSLFRVTVPSYEFRKAPVMRKAFHGVINIWQKTQLFFFFFYQSNICTISFLFSPREPRVTVQYRLFLLSRSALFPNQPHTSVHPIPPIWDHGLKSVKDKAFSRPLWSWIPSSSVTLLRNHKCFLCCTGCALLSQHLPAHLRYLKHLHHYH